MKQILIILSLVVVAASFPACKKTVEKKAEDYIIGIMTDGRWYVHRYFENSDDITYEFDGYEFQFYDNNKVDAIRASQVATGSWVGNISNFTIASNFPAAPAPLQRLNYTWKITDSYTNAVFAETTDGTTLLKIQLVKK